MEEFDIGSVKNLRVKRCLRCKGKGKIIVSAYENMGNTTWVEGQCPDCGGDGFKLCNSLISRVMRRLNEAN